MTQSFDEWLESMGHMDGYQHHYQDAYDTGYEVGAQSRQSEVDELQKRIDEALRFANDAHSDLNIGMLKMVEILKGKQDD